MQHFRKTSVRRCVAASWPCLRSLTKELASSQSMTKLARFESWCRHLFRGARTSCVRRGLEQRFLKWKTPWQIPRAADSNASRPQRCAGNALDKLTKLTSPRASKTHNHQRRSSPNQPRAPWRHSRTIRARCGTKPSKASSRRTNLRPDNR